MNHIIQKKLFSQDECDYFKSLSNDKTFERSKITEHINSNIISECRTSLEVDIKLDSDLSNIILEKVKEFGIRTLPNYFIILKFDSSMEHCANKIIEGVRYSMVLWLSIDDFGLTKSLI